jgi:hypothetical protein
VNVPNSGIDLELENYAKATQRLPKQVTDGIKAVLDQYFAGNLGSGGSLLLNSPGQTVLQPFNIPEATSDIQPVTQGRLVNDVGPVAADVADALSRVQVVLVDPGDPSPSGFANAIFIENAATIDDPVRYSTQDDSDLLSTTG